MTFDEAARVLGVRLPGLTENAVRLAYASAVKLAHPDVGGGASTERGNLDRLREAKDTLLRITAANTPESIDDSCTTCRGTGSVRGTLFNVVCKSCKGSGKDADLSRRR